jgi:DNA-binding transcriptional regulator YiaG
MNPPIDAVRRETRLPYVVSHYAAPTIPEFQAVARTLQLSDARVALLLGVGKRTVARWITGRSEIPYAAWRLLLIHAGLALETASELEQLRSVVVDSDVSP